MKYLFPCIPNRINPESKYFDTLDKDRRWIAQVKKNGWRCLVYKEDGKVILWNRHKRLITEALPEIRESFQSLPDETILDGELIFTRRVKDIPEAFYLFDVIIFKGDLLYQKSFSKRRGILEIIHKDYLSMSPVIELARQVQVGKKALYYQSIEGDLNEGIVMKNLDSKYPISDRISIRNPHWIKVKKTEKHLIAKEK
jgi:ATP-dependent DNA ligase